MVFMMMMTTDRGEKPKEVASLIPVNVVCPEVGSFGGGLDWKKRLH